MSSVPRRSRSVRPYAAPATIGRKPAIRPAPSPLRKDPFADASEPDDPTCAIPRPGRTPSEDVHTTPYAPISERLDASPPPYNRGARAPAPNDDRERIGTSPGVLPKSTPRLADVSASSERHSRSGQTSVRPERAMLNDEMSTQPKDMTLNDDTRPRSIIVERQSTQAPRKRLVFAPGQVRLTVPLEATHGSMDPTALAYLLFDGVNLEISAAMAAVPLMVDGHVVAGGEWNRLKIPCTLQVGDDTFNVYCPDLKTRKISNDMDFSDEETRCHPEAFTRLEDTKGGWTAAPVAKAMSVAPASSTPAPFVISPTPSTRSTPPPTARRDTPTASSPSNDRLSRRRRILAVASGAISAIITTMLLVGGSPSSNAVPRTRAAMASESVHAVVHKDTNPAVAVANGAAPTAEAVASTALPPQGEQNGATPSNRSKETSGATDEAKQAHSLKRGGAEKTSAPSGATADPKTDTETDDKTANASKSSTERVTLEREAVDLLARGAFMEAAAAYRELARRNPDRPLFYQAAAFAEQQTTRTSK